MVKNLKLNVVVENSASIDNPNVWAQHGLCLLFVIELSNTEEINILMDVGSSSEVTLHNVDILKLDLSKIDLVFLSHGHNDHVGGLIEVLKRIGKPIPVIAHPNILNPKLRLKSCLKFIGLPFTAAQAEKSGAIMIYAKNSVTFAKDVITTGEIERVVPFERIEGFHTVKDEKFTEDSIQDDQALVINIEGKGLAIFLGCAHSGIINTLKHAQKITGINEVYSVMGGFHLINANEERIKSTIDELQKLDPRLIAPGHCTGIKAISRLIDAFGDRCKPLTSGAAFEL